MKSFRDDYTIDLRKVRVLQALHELGTISATAAALHLTPSAVSQQIANLGREIGAPLLVRQGRGVRLTQQAHLLIEHAAVLRQQLESARADLAAYDLGEVGRVAVGGFATSIPGLIAPAVAAIRRDRPRMRLTVLEVEAPENFMKLDAGDLDLVVTVDYRYGPIHKDPRYHRVDLLTDEFEVALPEAHPLSRQEMVGLIDLAGDTWVLGAAGGTCREVSLTACTAAGFTPDVRHYANDWTAVLALVAAGAGVALIPRLAVSTRGYAGVVLLPTQGQQRPARHIYAAVRAGSEHSPALSYVLEVLQAIAGTNREMRIRSGQAAPLRPA